MEGKIICRDCGKEINTDKYYARSVDFPYKYLCGKCWVDYANKKGKYNFKQ